MLNTFSTRALQTPLLLSKNSISLAEYAYFFFYSLVRDAYIRRLTQQSIKKGTSLPALSTAAELLLGAVAGALAQIFTIPVSVIATRQQVGRAKLAPPPAPAPRAPSEVSAEKPAYSAVADPRATDASAAKVRAEARERDDSFLGVARAIVREQGVTGLWLGLRPSLVLTVNPAITYGMFERLKGLLLGAKALRGSGKPLSRLTPWEAFVIGALSKTLATIVCLRPAY